MPRYLLLIGSLFVVAVVACGSPQAKAPSVPAASPTASDNDYVAQAAAVVAVANQVYPQENGVYSVCGADGNAAKCPYSDRLKARLVEIKQTLLRAQNPSTTFSVAAELLGPDTAIAHVSLFQGRTHFDLWLTRQAGGLVVDDQICSGRKDTSIYATPFVVCGS